MCIGEGKWEDEGYRNRNEYQHCVSVCVRIYTHVVLYVCVQVRFQAPSYHRKWKAGWSPASEITRTRLNERGCDLMWLWIAYANISLRFSQATQSSSTRMIQHSKLTRYSMVNSDGEQMLEISAMHRTSSQVIAIAVSVLAHVQWGDAGKLER